MGESSFLYRGVRSDVYFLFHLSLKFLCANRIAPDGTPRSAASHLGLYCLPIGTPGLYELTHMSCDARKMVFGVSDQRRHKPTCSFINRLEA